MKVEKVLSRIEYCIEEAKERLSYYEGEYSKAPYGNYAIDLTMTIKEIKGEIKALKEMQDYIEMIK